LSRPGSHGQLTFLLAAGPSPVGWIPEGPNWSKNPTEAVLGGV
jgi:hypothetical protein